MRVESRVVGTDKVANALVECVWFLEDCTRQNVLRLRTFHRAHLLYVQRKDLCWDGTDCQNML